MGRARNLGEEPRLHVVAGPQQIDRLRGRGRDRVFALDKEEAELVAPALLVQLAHELQALVVLRTDHRPQSSHSPWKSNTATRCGPLFGNRSTSSEKPSSSGARPVVTKTSGGAGHVRHAARTTWPEAPCGRCRPA